MGLIKKDLPMKILQQSRIIGIALLLIFSAIYWSRFYWQIQKQIHSYGQIYQTALSAGSPQVTFLPHRIQIQGTLPCEKKFPGSVYVLFDTTGQMTQLPADAANGSLLFMATGVQIRFYNTNHDIPINDVKLNGKSISTEMILKFIAWMRGPFLTILAIVGWLVCLIVIVTLALLGMIFILIGDTLFNSSIAAKLAFNLAVGLLVLAWLLFQAGSWLELTASRPVALFLGIYLILLLAGTYLVKRGLALSNPIDPKATEMEKIL